MCCLAFLGVSATGTLRHRWNSSRPSSSSIPLVRSTLRLGTRTATPNLHPSLPFRSLLKRPPVNVRLLLQGHHTWLPDPLAIVNEPVGELLHFDAGFLHDEGLFVLGRIGMFNVLGGEHPVLEVFGGRVGERQLLAIVVGGGAGLAAAGVGARIADSLGSCVAATARLGRSGGGRRMIWLWNVGIVVRVRCGVADCCGDLDGGCFGCLAA